MQLTQGRGAKTELEDLGEDTTIAAEGMSKYRDEFKALSGVDIMADEAGTKYKNLYQIFAELRDVWDDIDSDASKQRIAEILGGNRQYSAIMSTLNNFTDAQKAYTDATNSAGTATEANAIYMDTASAHMEQLRANFQELSYDVVNSDFIKLFTGGVSGLIKGLDAIGETIGTFGSSVAAFATIKGFKNFISILKEPETTLGDAISGVFPKLSKLKEYVKGLSKTGESGSFLGALSYANINPAIAGVTALTASLAAAYVVYKKFFSAEAKRNKSIESLGSAASAKEELQSIQDEIKSTSEAINDLEAKPNLTFVEQDQLASLREVTKELEAQKVIQEEIAQIKAADSVKDTKAAWDKNGGLHVNAGTLRSARSQIVNDASQISAQSGIGYYNALIGSINKNAVNNKDDLSSQIAGLIQAQKAINDLDSKKDADLINNFNEQIKHITSDMGGNLETLNEWRQTIISAFPNKEDQEKYGITDTLDGINLAIDNILKQTNPQKWRELKLSELFSDEKLSNQKEGFLELAKAAGKTGVSVKDLKDKYPELASALQSVGIPLSDFVSDINAAASGSEEAIDVVDGLSDYTEESANSFESAAAAAAAFAEALSLVNSALSESRSATGVTAETVGKLVDQFKDLDGFSPDKLFERTANGTHLNNEELKKMTQLYNQTKLGEAEQKVLDLQKKIYQERERGGDSSGLEEELMVAEALRNQYEGMLSAYNAFQTAKSATDERAGYEDINGSYKEVKDLIDRGWTNDSEVTSYLDLMLGDKNRTDDAVADFQKLTQTIEGTQHSLMDYFKVDENGNSVTDGLFDFLDDVKLKFGETFADVDENGRYKFDFDEGKLQDVADAFGTSTEYVEQLMRAMVDAGMAVDMSDSSIVKSVEKAKEAIQSLKDEGNGQLANVNLDFDLESGSLEDVRNTIESLKNERATIKVDEEGGQEAANALDVLIDKCNQEYYLRVETEYGADTLNTAIETVEKLKKVLGESSGVEMTSQVQQLASQIKELPDEVEIAIGINKDSVNDTDAIIQQIKEQPETINTDITVTDAATDQAKKAKEAAESIPKRTKTNITATNNVAPVVANARSQLKSIDGTRVKTYIDVVQNGSISAPKGGGKGGGSHKGIQGGGSLGGTAHLGGHAYSASSIFPKEWLTKASEMALVGEEGREIVSTRDGYWYTVGDNGAQFARIPKNSVVFDARQTEELLRTGQITTRGKAYLSGSAYLRTGAESGSGGTRRSGSGNSTSIVSSASSASSSSASKAASAASSAASSAEKAAEDTSEAVDWIERAVKRIERVISNAARIAESAYHTITDRLSATGDEISAVLDEIDIQRAGSARYLQQANSVGLSEDLAAKVRDGTINIEEYSQETRDLITKYQEWYYSCPLRLYAENFI